MNNNLIEKIKAYIPCEGKLIEIQDEGEYIDISLENKRFLVFTHVSVPSSLLQKDPLWWDGSQWEAIKNIIDLQMDKKINKECPLCLLVIEGAKEVRRVSCPSCAENWCVRCYLTSLRDRKYWCPCCKFCFGKHVLPCFTAKL